MSLFSVINAWDVGRTLNKAKNNLPFNLFLCSPNLTHVYKK